MIESYFDIPYEEALRFLNSLSDNDIKSLLDDYSAKNIDDLADAISDTDLLHIGYIYPEKEESDSEYIYNNVESIKNFLENLDSDILDELKSKYDTLSVVDLAIAITDNDLLNLGYNLTTDTSIIEENITNTSNVLVFDSNCYSISDDLDFLEDVDSDINFAIIDKNNYVFAVKDEIDYNRFKNSLDNNLINYCTQLDYSGDTLEDNGVYFQLVPYNFSKKNEIYEEVIINDELNPNIFDKDHNMIEDVRQQLIHYYELLIQYLKDRGITLDVQDVTLVGSNAGYLYTPESDIDLHIIVDYPLNVDTFETLKNEFDLFEAENPLIIGNNNVEIGIEDGYNTKMSIEKPRRYSIIDSNWVDGSDAYEIYTADDIEFVNGYEDIVDDYVERIDYVISHDEYSDAVNLKKEIRQNRSNDLAEKGALSIGNVVFKELRNNGSYGKLKDYLKEKDINTIVEIDENVGSSDKLKQYNIKKALDSDNLDNALSIINKYDKELYKNYSDWAEKLSIDDYTLTNDKKLKHLRDLIHDKYYD